MNISVMFLEKLEQEFKHSSQDYSEGTEIMKQAIKYISTKKLIAALQFIVFHTLHTSYFLAITDIAQLILPWN